MTGITALDYILLPFYLWLIYKIAYYYRDKYYPEGHPYHKYFIYGLTAKIAGALFIAMFYWYYYGGGDTTNYFYHTQIINSTFIESPGTWFRLITHQADESNLTDARAVSRMFWYEDKATYTTSCLAAFIGMFCFTQYLIINVIIAAITFIGTWLLFITFTLQYSKLIKQMAIAVLFMPGPLVWGSGLFKDSFCMFAIGCLIYCAYILFEKRNFKFTLLLLLIVSIVLLFLIKAYILVSLFPFLIVKIILVYKKKSTTSIGKRVVFYICLGIFLFLSSIVVRKSLEYLTSFSVDNVVQTVKHQQLYLLGVSLKTDGSAYDLGDFDPSVAGMLKLAGPAVNVTLFRPYLWESRSIIQIFNSLETTGVLLLTLYLIFKRNIFKTIKNIYLDPNLIMCLCFTLVFAFFVGISSYNFGTLSRYKIPCTPFYMVFLMVLIYKDQPIAEEEEPKTITEPATAS